MRSFQDPKIHSVLLMQFLDSNKLTVNKLTAHASMSFFCMQWLSKKECILFEKIMLPEYQSDSIEAVFLHSVLPPTNSGLLAYIFYS